MIIRILILLLLLTGCISGKDSGDVDPPDLVLGSGDFVKIDYVGRIEETGEVFDTTNADVAFNPDIGKTDRFTFADKYEPMSFTVGKGQILPVFEAGMIGMRVGDTRYITLAPEDAYGEWSSEYILALSRVVALPKLTDVLLSDFIAATGREPEVNETIQLNYWKARVVNISDQNMTFLHEPEDNTIVSTEYGPTHITLNDTHVITTLNPEGDSVVTTSYGVAVITDVNETHFIIDYNHPLTGKTLVFEVTVRDIMKAGQVLAQKITWTDYETGLDIAKNEKKPAIVVFYLDDCPACEALDNLTFSNPQVTELKDRFVWIKVDAAANPQVAGEYDTKSYPTIVLLDRAGEVSNKITGYIPPAELKREMNTSGKD
jgi:FKBP-type peptidyl-prolyl cis-trans isomerase 2